MAYVGFLIQGRNWYKRKDDWETYFPIFLFNLVLMVMMIAVNTWLLYRLRKNKNTLQYVIWITCLILGYTAIKGIFDTHNVVKTYDLDYSPYGTYLWSSFLYAIWFAVISSMLFITQAQYDDKQELKNVKINQLETELKYLKAQINPHFLFNGLNTIFGFIDKNNQQAKDALLQFSDLLRYNLYEADVDKIDLLKEVGYIENYVAIQKAKSDSNLKIDLNVSIGDNDVKIAPLLFLPFIENAFKYVSRDEQDKSTIRISIACDNHLITFECVNSFEDVATEAKGIGLENVKRRLDLLYKDTYELFTWKRDNIWHVKLKLMA
jgi:hypothetical protein